MTTDPGLPDGPALRAGLQLLSDLRNEIARADAKAAVLAGVLGMSAGVLGALVAGSGWTPALLPQPLAVLWWAGTAFLVTALFALLLTVVPRYPGNRWAPGLPLTYFGDVQRAARTGQLTMALVETCRDPSRSLLLALARTSSIASRKHFWIRIGLIAFGCAALLLPASLLLA